jgi:hypothetical protein
MSVTMADLMVAFAGVVPLDPDPADVELLLEHPVTKAPSIPTASAAATYVIHFDLTEIPLLYTRDMLPHSF